MITLYPAKATSTENMRRRLIGEGSMADEMALLEERKGALLGEINDEEKRYYRRARSNFYAAQIFLWAAVLAGSVAALIGIVPKLSDLVAKWELGLLSAMSVFFVTFSQQVGFQRK